MRTTLKQLAATVSPDTWERLLTYSVMKRRFRAIDDAPRFDTREALWDTCLQQHLPPQASLTFVEFGVHEGYSLGYFAERNRADGSLFVGLDSFEGLPESWGGMPKGSFDVKGMIPSTRDHRVQYIKGWFQDTAGLLLERLRERRAEPLVVHYDADLYSSTLFALTQIATLDRSYLAIFDEFIGHESRALYNFAQAFDVKIEMLGKTLWREKYPQQLLCRIVPRSQSDAT